MLKNVEPARFTRVDANLDVLDRLLLRRFAGKARKGEAKALPPNSAEVHGLDIKLAEASGTWERRFSYAAANGRGHFMLVQTVPHPKTTYLRLERERPSEHGARRDGGEGTRHLDGASR